MSSKIIIPDGKDLIYYLNEGYAICNQCGAIMDRTDVYICPNCGWVCEPLDYEYERDENNIDDSELIPPSCAACGGPYPQCKISCKLYDD